MEGFSWKFFMLALLGTTGLMGIGIGIAEGSSIIILSAIILTLVSVGTGFTLKKKLNAKAESHS
ncbi:hypothetical protein J2S74_001238 [Evansella vedderi]|uniref:Uncharacterized protein n=1 Tax=Evansella vedderi TaxID=38282 RepID=A0ABT9ZRK3_9BACI|nr:DUF5325 family protein [Evansella vedderi]MDQ0253866.1 hypothetical protein [Evansella vedderi]